MLHALQSALYGPLLLEVLVYPINVYHFLLSQLIFHLLVGQAHQGNQVFRLYHLYQAVLQVLFDLVLQGHRHFPVMFTFTIATRLHLLLTTPPRGPITPGDPGLPLGPYSYHDNSDI